MAGHLIKTHQSSLLVCSQHNVQCVLQCFLVSGIGSEFPPPSEGMRSVYSDSSGMSGMYGSLKCVLQRVTSV